MPETPNTDHNADLEPQIPIEIGDLVDFDKEYFEDIKSRDKKLRRVITDDPKYKYFTVLSADGKKLGFIGVYDADGDTNLTDTIVDPRYRGLGLAKKFKDALMGKLDLPFVTLTIDYDKNSPKDPNKNNVNSLRSAEKLPGIERIDDPKYTSIQKAKFIYRRRNDINDTLSGDKSGGADKP